MNSTRVKLTFHHKSQKHSDGIPARSVWFLIDKSLKTVKDVQAKICQRYSINARRLDLFIEDSIIPACESASVFRENDVVLVRVKRNQTEEVIQEVQNGNETTRNKTTTESSSRRRKRKIDTSVRDESVSPKQSVQPSNGDRHSESDLVEVVEIEERKSADGGINIEHNTSTASASKLDESASETPENKKRRRKRTRNRKKKDQEISGEQNHQQAFSRQGSIHSYISRLSITQPEQRLQSPKSSCTNNPGHVHFSDDDQPDAGRLQIEDEMKTNSNGTAPFVVNSECEAASIVNMSQNFEDEVYQKSSSNSVETDNYMAVSGEGVYSNHGSKYGVSSPRHPTFDKTHRQNLDNSMDASLQGGDVLDILQACKGQTSSPHRKAKRSATDVVKNAVVFSRKSFQWKRFSPLSKAQQLASKQENVSVVLQNPPTVMNAEFNQQNKTDYSSMSYHSLPVLKEPPAVGRTVAFKMLELGPNFTPEVSDFKVAKVLGFEPHSKCLELELLSGSIGGILLDDSTEAEKIITVTWTSMMEPKVVEEEML